MRHPRFDVVTVLGFTLAAVVAVVLLALLALAAVLLPASASAQEPVSATRIYLPLLRSPGGSPVVERFVSGGGVVAFGGRTPGMDAPSRAYLLRCASRCADAGSWSGPSPTPPPSG